MVGGRGGRGGRGGGRGGRGRAVGAVAHRGSGNGNFGTSRPSMSLNDRFTQLTNVQKPTTTTFRAVLNSDKATKFGRNNGTKQKGGERGGRVQGRGGKGAGARGNGGRRNSNPKTKKLSKDQLDMQLDEIMGRDPKETQRSRLDEDMDSYWNTKPASQVPIST